MCHLPRRDEKETLAFKRVIAYLEKQRKLRIGARGYTYSGEGAFLGFWWDAKTRRYVEDDIVLVIIDYKIPLSHPDQTIDGKVNELKRVIRRAYEHYDRAQQEVWVVSERITRH